LQMLLFLQAKEEEIISTQVDGGKKRKRNRSLFLA
jgi:hypothetical protein